MQKNEELKLLFQDQQIKKKIVMFFGENFRLGPSKVAIEKGLLKI